MNQKLSRPVTIVFRVLSRNGRTSPPSKRVSRRITIVFCLLSLLAPQLALAQQPPAQSPAKQFELTVDSVMRGPRLVGYQPAGVYWSQDSQRVYFRWKQANEPRLKEMS